MKKLFAATATAGLMLTGVGTATPALAASNNTKVYYMDWYDCTSVSKKLVRDGAHIVVNCSWAASGGWAYLLSYHY